MNIFESDDYKSFLRSVIAQASRRGFLTELARMAGCTQSYLSQVLGGKPELTPDQAIAIAEALALSEGETRYFIHLVHYGRATTPRLKSYYQRKLKLGRERALKLSSAVAKTNALELSGEQIDFYYSVWTVSAIHILTACSDYQRPESIAARLSLPVREVEVILQRLVKSQLVVKKQGKYSHSGQHLHLPTQSLHNHLNHFNWRTRGLQSTTDESALHYTSVFAVDREEWPRLRRNLLSFIETQRRQIAGSGAEDGFAFCCDLFEI